MTVNKGTPKEKLQTNDKGQSIKHVNYHHVFNIELKYSERFKLDKIDHGQYDNASRMNEKRTLPLPYVDGSNLRKWGGFGKTLDRRYQETYGSKDLGIDYSTKLTIKTQPSDVLGTTNMYAIDFADRISGSSLSINIRDNYYKSNFSLTNSINSSVTQNAGWSGGRYVWDQCHGINVILKVTRTFKIKL